jgi:hypothetical protein
MGWGFISDAIDWVSDLGESVYKPLAGEKTSNQEEDEKQAKDRARAQADAAIRQAEYEEQAGMGAERTRAKRRRGYQSTILTGPGQTTGAAATGGKTLLGE